MIFGIGVDAIEIERFASWHTYPFNRLKTIFTEAELSYILAQEYTAQHFAVRFAAKEACYKAVSEYLKDLIGLRTFMQHCAMTQNLNGKPSLSVAWDLLVKPEYKDLALRAKAHISVTHTDTLALAYVIIEKNAGN